MKRDKDHVGHLQTDEEFWEGVNNSYKNLRKLAVFIAIIAFLMHYFN